jgi:uncharacterized protein YndB with AHSA1/START domain
VRNARETYPERESARLLFEGVVFTRTLATASSSRRHNGLLVGRDGRHWTARGERRASCHAALLGARVVRRHSLTGDVGLRLDMQRVLGAPRAVVFRALSEPQELARWWGPEGFTVPSVECDLRPGGQYRIAMQPPEGELFHLAGEFLEVEPPQLLAYTFRWEPPDPEDRETVVRLWLRDLGGTSTELVFGQGDFATEARRALHEDGWTQSLDKLERLISSAASS